MARVKNTFPCCYFVTGAAFASLGFAAFGASFFGFWTAVIFAGATRIRTFRPFLSRLADLD